MQKRAGRCIEDKSCQTDEHDQQSLRINKVSAFILKAMVIPRSRETRLERTFCAVSERLFSTPHSRSRLPNIRNPTRETDIGATSPATKVTTMGKMIFAFLETLTALYSIWMQRSFLVVSRRITIGWIMGTRAIYEYATTAMGPM